MQVNAFNTKKLIISGLAVIAGILLSISVFLYAKNRADYNFENRFQDNAETRASLLITSLNNSLENIETLGRYYDFSDHISREDFKQFITPHAVDNNCILTFEWVPVVPETSRQLYEETARKDGIYYFNIWESNSAGNPIPALKREIYYPIYYRYPDDYNKQLLGMDLGTNPKNRALFAKARDSGKTIATGRFNPIENKTGQYCFLVIRPVYDRRMLSNTTQDRRRSHKGFIIGVFGAGNILQSALKNTPPMDIPFYFFDMSAPEGSRLLHHSKPWLGFERWNSFMSVFYPDYPKYIKEFSFAGRKYIVEITAGTSYMVRHYSLNYYLILLLGFILTIYAALYIRSVLVQREKASLLITLRTSELTESQELFRLAFQDSGIGVVLLDTDGNFLKVNKAFSAIVGYGENELLTINFKAITFPEDLHYEIEKLQQLLNGTINTYSMEKRYICKNDNTVWAMINVSIIRSEEGSTKYLVSQIYDISDRKRAEAFQQVLMDAVPSPIFYKDAEGVYIGGNKAFERYLGLNQEQFIGKTVYDISPVDLAEKYDKADRDLLNSPSTQTYEASVVYADGTRHDVVFNKAAFNNPEGKVAGLIGVILDITERKQAEDALLKTNKDLLDAISQRESALKDMGMYQTELTMQNEELRTAQKELEAAHSRYFDLYNLAPVGYCTVNEKGLILEANLTASTLLGMARSSLVKQPISRFIYKEDQDIYYLHRKQLFETGEPKTCEFRMLNAKAAPFWVRLEATPAQDADGATVCRFVISNITERKQAEATLLEHRDHLEELVSKRTLELEAKNLKLAEEINERKQAEDALKESEQRFKSIVDNITGLVWRCLNDENWTAIYVSDYMEKLSGYPASDYIGNKARALSSAIHPDDAERVFKETGDAVGDKRPYSIEYRTIHRDGSIIWLNERGKGVFDEEGNLLYLDGITLDINEKKHMEQALAESEERLKIILENSNDIFVLMDKNGNQAYISPIVEKITGYTADELVKKPFEIVIHPEDLDYVNEAWRRCLENPGVEVRLTYRHIHKEKGYVWFEAIITNYLDNPAVCVVVDNVRDITDRKQIEEALKESEAKYRFLVDNMSDVLWTTDLNMNTTYVSPSIVQMGFTPEERCRQKLEEQLTHESMKKCTETMLAEIKKDRQPGIDMGRVVVLQLEQYLKDGSTRFYEHRIKLLRNEKGDIIGFQGMANNIHERKKAEEHIRKLSGAVEESKAAVIIANYEGKIEYVNPSFTRSTGYTAEEVVGENIGITNPNIPPDEIYTQLFNIIRTGKAWEGELLTMKKSGELFWENASVSPIHNEEGDVTHFVAVGDDISERKKMEEELFKAKEAAEAANRAKSSFLANMSHELRTPLNAIIGFSQVLNDDYYGKLNEKQLKFVSDIEKGGLHLLSLINDILDISKIEAGNIQLDLGQIIISKLVQASLSVIEQKAAKHGISLNFECAHDVEDLFVLADEIKIKQVLYNLLSNASKFTPDMGSISLNLSRDEDMVYVTVADTGIGIDPQYTEKIFEPFFQVMGEHQEKSRGTGLGMSISRQIIEMHGGNIWVKSDGLGKGCSFTFSLPTKL